jgi:hypothetical protein
MLHAANLAQAFRPKRETPPEREGSGGVGDFDRFG